MMAIVFSKFYTTSIRNCVMKKDTFTHVRKCIFFQALYIRKEVQKTCLLHQNINMFHSIVLVYLYLQCTHKQYFYFEPEEKHGKCRPAQCIRSGNCSLK